MFVFDMEAGLHAVGDDPRAIAIPRGRRRAGDAEGKQQPHTVRATEIEVLADDGFKEVAALHRSIKDLRETDLELTDREAMVVAGGAVGRQQGPRQAVRPPIEEGLDVGGAERVACLLQRLGIRTRQKTVIEAFEAHAVAAEPLLDPLMAIETQLYRIRKIRADLQERRAPVAV